MYLLAAIFSESTEFEVSEGLSGEFSCQARNLAGLGDKCSVQVNDDFQNGFETD